MPVGFGFSVGDFIAGINLLIETVKSFSETHGAKADHQELGRELISLKNALDGIQALSLNTAQAAQISAVNAAVDSCRSCRWLRAAQQQIQKLRMCACEAMELSGVQKWCVGC